MVSGSPEFLDRKRKEADEGRCVPLPVQSFLWRQTNPFLGPKIGKLHEASCVTFERVLVQNILHGLSPNLSEAIKSIPRWRFVRTAFPHVVHCCAALLIERSESEEKGRLSQSLLKMLYILHWLVFDSAVECMDTESNDHRIVTQEEMLNQHLFSVQSIQIFVYMLVPLIHLLSQVDIVENIRLEAGLSLWQALWQYQQPDVLCFAAPVKPRTSQLMCLPLLKRALQPSLAAKNIYMGGGGVGGVGGAGLSTDLSSQSPKLDDGHSLHIADPKQLQKKSSLMSILFSEKRTAANGDGKKESREGLFNGILQKKKKNGTEEVMNLESIARYWHYIEDNCGETVDCSDRAPLVCLGEICGPTTWSNEDLATPGSYTHYKIICELCDSAIYENDTGNNACKCNQNSPQHISSPEHRMITQQYSSPCGSEHMSVSCETPVLSSFAAFSYNKIDSSHEEVPPVPLVRPPSEEICDQLPSNRPQMDVARRAEENLRQSQKFDTNDKKLNLKNEDAVCALSSGESKSSTPVSQALGLSSLQATYMDVAVVRCLFIRQWAESGVYWALCYYYNRLRQIYEDTMQASFSRHRSFSMPIPSERKVGVSQAPCDNFQKEKLQKHKLEDFKASKAASTRRTNYKKNEKKSSASEDSSGSQSMQVANNQWIKRCATDSEISYYADFFAEAVGSTPFILKNGDLNLNMIVRAAFEVTNRPMTFRICETLTKMLQLVIDMNLFEQIAHRSDDFNDKENTKNEQDLEIGLNSVDSKSCTNQKPSNTSTENSIDEEMEGNVYLNVLEAVIKILLYLGCPNGCNDSLRTLQANFLRNQSKACLSSLQKMNSTLFSKGLLDFFENNELAKVVDFLHVLLGFCTDPSASSTTSRSVSRIVRTKPDTSPNPTYKNKFLSDERGIEGVVVSITLKPLVTKMVNQMKEIKQPENMSLHYDIRLLMNYLQIYHGHPFRMVELSALTDTVQRTKLTESNAQTSKCFSPVDSDSDSSRMASPAPYYSREWASMRQRIFRRSKRQTEDSEKESNSGSPRFTLTNDSYLAVSPSSPLLSITSGRKKGRKLPLSLNILKSVRSESQIPSVFDDMENSSSDIDRSIDDLPSETAPDKKHKKKFLFISSFTNLKSQPRDRLRPTLEDLEESDDLDMKLKTVMDSLNIPPKDMVSLGALQDGIRRFNFILETCRPGTAPDPPLVASMLDLKAPVISRAAVLVECAYFVHRCNRGYWPEWIRMGQPSKSFTSGAPLGRGTPSVLRGTNLLQKNAGKMFYHWALALGSKLNSILNQEKSTYGNFSVPSDELLKTQLRVSDDLEDFFDESIVNASGEECPIALKMIACMLLLEISAFLRESYQAIICSRAHMRKHSKFEKFQSQRRWSVLSATFSPSRQSESLQSIADLPNQILFPHSERRISFCTLDGDHSSNESQHASDDHPTSAESRRMTTRRSTTAVGKNSKHSAFLTGSVNRRSIHSHKKDVKAEESERRRKSRLSSTASDDFGDAKTGSGELTGSRLMSAESLHHESSLADTSLHEGDDFLIKGFPWIQTVAKLVCQFNFSCNHHKVCHPLCFERCYRQSYRLAMALRKVYGETFPWDGQFDRRKAIALNFKERYKEKLAGMKPKTSNTQSLDGSISKSVLDRTETNSSIKPLSVEKLSSNEAKVKSAENYHQEVAHPTDGESDQQTLQYIKFQVKNPCHAPLSTFMKCLYFASDDDFTNMIHMAWAMMLQQDSHVSTSADVVLYLKQSSYPDCIIFLATSFIACSVKLPALSANMLNSSLHHSDPAQRLAAVLRFYVLWKNRYHAWLMMEDKAQALFKTPPPNIDFSMPSPPVGQPQEPIVDPSWMPHVKTNLQELKLKEDTMSQSIMTMTKTRRKQKQELVKRAMQHAEEAKSGERAKFTLYATAVIQQAAYEPALFQLSGSNANEEEDGEGHTTKQVPLAQLLFPSTLCSAAVDLIQLLDDDGIDSDGTSVSEVVNRIVWTCMVEDSTLFFRYIFEKLTNDKKQEFMISTLRKLILHYDTLPSQAAYVLLNYMIGFVMYYVRSPSKDAQVSIARGISLLWLVVPSMKGIFFKDLKQTLRKEQCDGTLLITANVPSAKKIIVHGPEVDSIPSQFQIHEVTQFQHLMSESLEFFNIPLDRQREFFLIDLKTGLLRSQNAFVRDYYPFRRSYYPELKLVQLQIEEAKKRHWNAAYARKSSELGKVLFTLSLLKHCPENTLPQRVYFLHEELTKLPSFPRIALEPSEHPSDVMWSSDLYGIDVLTKFSWEQLMHYMLRALEYTYGDLHLFINVVNGILILHCEDASILRHCMATYIEIAHHFKVHFSTNGFFMIMPTILRCFSHYQTNDLLCDAIRFTCKQFYIMHRKPFILQMFGAVANILDFDENEQDFSLMQIVVQAILPYFLKDIALKSKQKGNDSHAYRNELQMLNTLNVEMKTLIECCDVLARHEMQKLNNFTELLSNLLLCFRSYSGPQRSFDIVSSSGRKKSFTGGESPQLGDIREESIIIRTDPKKMSQWETTADSEVQREMFRKPRDALLCLSATFLRICSPRIKYLSKLLGESTKVPDILDHKAHLKLAEVAYTLLKLAPYDAYTMNCEGLQRYFMDILPVTDWSAEQNRPALNNILRRLDKTIGKIVKKSSMRRRINWEAISSWLQGLHKTLTIFPYVANFYFLKATVQLCLKVLVGDTSVIAGSEDSSFSVVHGGCATVLVSFFPPRNFCSAIIKLTIFLMQALGEQSFSLEYICSSETLGSLSSERIEAVACNVLVPLFLEISTRNGFQLRQNDIIFCLNHLLTAISPSTVKCSLVPTMHTGTSIRIDSTSATNDRPATFPSSTKGIRDSVYQAVFLTLKVMCVVFEHHLANEWCRIAKVVKELGAKRMGGSACWSFIEFAVTSCLPLHLLFRPFIDHKLLTLKNLSETDAQWQEILKERLLQPLQLFSSCKNTILLEFSNELKILKEDLSSRPIISIVMLPIYGFNESYCMIYLKEIYTLAETRSRTPTIMADMHSDTSSMQSSSKHHRGSGEFRAASSSLRLTRLSPTFLSKSETTKVTIEEKPIAEEMESEFLQNETEENTHMLRSSFTQRMRRKDVFNRLNENWRRSSRYSLPRNISDEPMPSDESGIEMTTLGECSSIISRKQNAEENSGTFIVSECATAKMDNSKIELV
ncbi:Protein unc-80 [Trichinella pseudospiralis]|uniref:Protein unc-80 n=1 Tax=Trichinella pseudospiralis TaxID=6337 RepID=A0A0V1K600_TRIPS|nr:Protein unc-80 [Trichinella pseudospiralis]